MINAEMTTALLAGSFPDQGERNFHFAGYFTFAIGIEMSIIFDPDSDNEPDDIFNINAVTLLD